MMCTCCLLHSGQTERKASSTLTRRCFFLRSGRAGGFLVAGRLPGASNRHLPDTDEVVTVSSKEGLAISTPSEGQTLGWVGPGGSRHLRPELLNHVLALQVPDLDGGAGGGAQPVPVGAEGEGIDGIG